MKKLREDLELREYAQKQGWTILLSSEDEINDKQVFFNDASKCPAWALRFRKDNIRIWECSKGWALSKVNDNNQYTSHQYFPTLKEALDYI